MGINDPALCMFFEFKIGLLIFNRCQVKIYQTFSFYTGKQLTNQKLFYYLSQQQIRILNWNSIHATEILHNILQLRQFISCTQRECPTRQKLQSYYNGHTKWNCHYIYNSPQIQCSCICHGIFINSYMFWYGSFNKGYWNCLNIWRLIVRRNNFERCEAFVNVCFLRDWISVWKCTSKTPPPRF